jgi:hypothetical protein
LAGQAVAIMLVTPFSLTANKLWTFVEPDGAAESGAMSA